MAPSFDVLALVSVAMAAAWLIALGSAQVGARLLVQVSTAHAGEATRWRVGAAVGLGTGIWASTVVGLSAAPVHFPLGYHPVGALASWALAALVGVLSLALPALPRRARLGSVAATLVLGIGMLAVQWGVLAATGVRPGPQWRLQELAPALLLAATGSGILLASLSWRQRTPRSRWGAIGAATAALVWSVALLTSQHLLLVAAGLAEQSFSAYEHRLAATSLTLLATVGTTALLAVMLLLARLDARARSSLVRTQGELEAQTLRDPLTSLPNRVSFEGTLAQAAARADAQRGGLALLFINVDRFKHVNQGFGHSGGDRLLREIASRLRSFARPHMVARVGGDEFVVLLNDNPSQDEVAAQAAGLLARLSEPFAPEGQDGQESAVSCSIGIALYPRDGAMSRLMAHADVAMRECKATGGASYCFFEPRMVSGAREQSELLRDLRLALPRRELELFYQPKIHAPSGEITGAEALVRWRHPRRGLVSPAVFIPVAERFGLIRSIGDWVIDEACRQARAWRDEGLRMRVAINLSPFQLRDPELGARIEAALEKYQINPKLLTCEITESVAMEDSQATARFFAALAGVGVHISIDDFGTGYSSLAYLRKLPAEELKIDCSFVCDLETSDEARTVVSAVVKLGQALNLKVVAEGVETEAQNQILRSLGCDELQGYLFARPMSAKALALWAINDVGPRPIVFRPSLFQPTAPAPMH
jgi:diguanylate cyclase (GGDEF)-like protein